MEREIVLQNRHWDKIPYPTLFHRKAEQNIIKKLSMKEIEIITGVRRSGKSSVLKLLINHLSEKINPKSIVYVNFEDPVFIPCYDNPKGIREVLDIAEKVTSVKPKYLLLDEIQNIKNWGKSIKSLYDKELYDKILVTGSNSYLLEKEYASLLAGRYLRTRIYPLSFKEILNIKNILNIQEIISNQPLVQSIVDNMLEFGSFAEVFKQKQNDLKISLIKEYFNSIVIRDGILHHNINAIDEFEKLAYYLINNPGNEYSYNSLSKNIGVDDKTLKKFIEALKNTMIISEIENFSFSLKTQFKSKKKVYAVDTGFYSQIAYRNSPDKGNLLENLVFTELLKNEFDIFYYKDSNSGNECDFVARKDNKYFAFQVCYELIPSNQDREIKGFSILQKSFPQLKLQKKIIITYNQKKAINSEIEAIPFGQFDFETI
jgi:hypothetical protein